MNCNDCIHCSACMHTRTAILDPYQACLSDKDTEECSDWHSCYIQETKYSRWEYYNDIVRCVNCDHYTNDAYFDEHDKIVLPRYCSNCGAKMDLEDK
jgi:hypothetical protein